MGVCEYVTFGIGYIMKSLRYLDKEIKKCWSLYSKSLHNWGFFHTPIMVTIRKHIKKDLIIPLTMINIIPIILTLFP